jgi:hypothetical protein
VNQNDVELLKKPRERFRQKFGRDPRPDDPIFWDESAAEPIEATLGGVVILGDIALAWVVLPEVFSYSGEEAIDAILHGGVSTLIAGVPGVLLYVNGIKDMTQGCE